MDEKLENVLDEIVWYLMQTLKNQEVDPYDASRIIDRIGRFATSGEFHDFYDEFSWDGHENPGFKEFVRDVINID